MVKTALLFSLIAFSASSSLAFSADVRFYKINKHEQTSKIGVTKKKTKQSGCHNFKRSPRVFTLVQTGYQSCSLFSEKNCASQALVTAHKTDSDVYSTLLTEGVSWQPKTIANQDLNALSVKEKKRRTKGVKLRSWSCLDKSKVTSN